MNNTAVITLVVVSVALTVFLILFSVALGYFISVLKQVRRITDKAEEVADTVESAATTFGKVASPLAVLKLIGGIVEHATRFNKKRKG